MKLLFALVLLASAQVRPFHTVKSYVVEPDGYVMQDVQVYSQAARVAAKITWADGTKDIDFYQTNSLCFIQERKFVGNGCVVVRKSIADFGTSEELSGDAEASETVRLWILNLSDSAENVTLRVAVAGR